MAWMLKPYLYPPKVVNFSPALGKLPSGRLSCREGHSYFFKKYGQWSGRLLAGRLCRGGFWRGLIWSTPGWNTRKKCPGQILLPSEGPGMSTVIAVDIHKKPTYTVYAIISSITYSIATIIAIHSHNMP